MAETNTQIQEPNPVAQQPPQSDVPPHGEREWTNSIWDCCKPADLCLQACFCPCVLFGKTHRRLEDPTMTDYSAVNKCCVAQCCLNLGGLAFLLPMMDRAEMRKRWGLKGSDTSDCLKTWCLGGMALLQHEKEAMLLSGGEQSNVSNQGYQTQAGMKYEAK